jgi:hypothetical protein
MGTMIAPDQLFDRAAAKLPIRRFPLLALGLACWLAAAAALAFALPAMAAAGLIAAGWLLTGLGEVRSDGQAATLPLVLLVIPFGFVLADPARALAGMFLSFSLAVWLTIGQGFGKSWFGVVVTLAYGVAALLPYYFSPLAYLIGVIAFVLTGQGAVRR